MSRNILLLEPNYKNKYPPIGLMKLATYHRMLGDNVRFFKGNLVNIIIEDIANSMLDKFNGIDSSVSWINQRKYFIQYIRTGNCLNLIAIIENSKYGKLLLSWCTYFRDFFKTGKYKKSPKWDRVCISTLFTFHWDITIKTIEKAKELVNTDDQIFVGGILATVLYKELKETTKVNVIPGLLNYKGALDDNDIIIDTLPLDYSILFETEYIYPANNAYFTYATRGCPNRCGFCAVPTLEPKFDGYISIKKSINDVKSNYGDKPNLLLLDNNVLASDNFSNIIEDIIKCGFEKDAIFIEPNYLDIFFRQLKANYNVFGFSRAIFQIYNHLLDQAKGEDKQDIYNILYENNLLDIDYLNKKALVKVYPLLKHYYEKYRNTSKRKRIVDFNQGLEAGKITEEKAKLLGKIAINPLRIAFDSITEKNIYVKAILLCKEHGIKSFSNYLLYNFNDYPVDLYKRLKINISLCEKQKINIYSFPMKYHPIGGDFSKNRDFIGEHWNRKYIRAIQIILNATKGKIGKGKSFFYKAFGKTIPTFNKLLLMPEAYLLYRFFFENIGLSQEWENDYNILSISERHVFFDLIKDNIFDKEIHKNIETEPIKKLYKHYLITRKDLEDVTTRLGKQKNKYDREIERKK